MKQLDISTEEEIGGDRDGVWPALMSMYHEQGYAEGYGRAVRDVLAAVLEATEEFARLHGDDDGGIRHQLYKFSAFLEGRVQTDALRDFQSFTDGLGI